MNAAGHDEKIMRIEVPEREDPEPLVVDVRMEPTGTADSTVSTGHYTYWVLNGNRVDGDATEAAAAADKTTVVLREPPTLEPEDKDYRDRAYVVVTNDVDDVDLQLMQPPMPVSSFSASAAAASTVVSSDNNRFCYHRVTTMITLVLGTCYVSAYSRR